MFSHHPCSTCVVFTQSCRSLGSICLLFSSAMQCGVVWSKQNSEVQYKSVQFSTSQCSSVNLSEVQLSSVQFSAVQ